MDLLAYMQMDKLEQILEKNKIEIPRLRGIATMENCEPATEVEIQYEKDEITYMLEEYCHYSKEDDLDLIEDARKRVEDKYVMRNKYCGRKDVLRVHARLGGGNWETYKNEIENKKWFLGKVDDGFDDTYCDIFVKIEDGNIA